MWLYSMTRLLPPNMMPMRGPSWIRLCDARLPHAVQRDAHALLVEHADVVDVVVVGVVLRRRERHAVAAAEADAVAADVVDVAADDAVLEAAADRDAGAVVVAHVADGAAGDQAVGGVLERDGRAFAALEGEAAERDVRGAGADLENRARGRRVRPALPSSGAGGQK